MSAQNGRLFRIAADDGTGTSTFVVIAGAREESMTIENGEINITNKDSNAKRELLEGGTQNVNCSCSGVFVAGTAAADITEKALAGTIDAYELEFEDGEKFEGNFQIRNYQRSGNHDNEVTFTCEFQSSGGVTHTAAA